MENTSQGISKKERRELQRTERAAAIATAKRNHMTKRYSLIALVSLLIAGGGYWWWNEAPRPDAVAYDPAKVCTTDPRTIMHIHPEVGITIDGQKQELPENIGVTAACMRPIHTHDATGVIHIESPVVRDLTLGEFFRVWDRPFDHEHLLDKTVDANHRIVMKIDGEVSEEYERLVLKDHQRVSLSYERIAAP